MSLTGLPFTFVSWATNGFANAVPRIPCCGAPLTTLIKAAAPDFLLLFSASDFFSTQTGLCLSRLVGDFFPTGRRACLWRGRHTQRRVLCSDRSHPHFRLAGTIRPGSYVNFAKVIASIVDG